MLSVSVELENENNGQLQTFDPRYNCCYNFNICWLLFGIRIVVLSLWIVNVIICVCRNIKKSDFKTQEELIRRIMELDKNCGRCQEYVQKLKELLYEVE